MSMKIRLQDAVSGHYQELKFTPFSVYFWDSNPLHENFVSTKRVRVPISKAEYEHGFDFDRIGARYEFFEWTWGKPFSRFGRMLRPHLHIQFWHPSWEGIPYPRVFITCETPSNSIFPSFDVFPDDYVRNFVPFMAQVAEFYQKK